MATPAIQMGTDVARNVQRFQLRRIIELAKQGHYGDRSAFILKLREAELAALEVR